MKHVAPLRYDVIFKKAFCDRDIFTAFVHDALGITIEIDKVETEKTFKPSIGRVASRYDLFAQDLKNRVIVDIQHVRHSDHYNAFLHYHCAAILEQAVNAKNYNPALTVYSLVVLTSGDKHKKDVLAIDFDPKDRQGTGVGEIPHKVFYVCPKYVNEETPEPLREWLRAIDDTLDEQVDESTYQNPQIQRIFDLIEADQISPEERASMFEEYNQQLLKEEGEQIGIVKGEQIGIAKGEQIGIAKAKLEIARSMLAKGMAIELIAELSGLSPDEVESAASTRFE